MLPLLALRAAKLVSRSRNVGSSSGESSSLVNGSYGPPKPTPKNMAQRMKRAVDRVFSKAINLNHVDTPLGIMEGTINSMMTALRSAIYPIVVIAIISAWFMFDDSMNPHLEGGKTWRGMIALPFYAGSMIVMMVINGTSFYVCAWSYFMGDKLKYPASYNEETGQIEMKSAGDVTGFSTKISPKIGCWLSASAFLCQIAVLIFRCTCSVRKDKPKPGGA